MNKKLVIITGPTGVGKTDFVDRLINRLKDKNQKAEMVNIDMGQFYEPLSIGTAKPPPVLRCPSNPELASAEVGSKVEGPQHLFDIIKKPENLTVTKYRKIVISKIEDLWLKNILPILVGGSAFYINSLFFPPLENEDIDKKDIDFSHLETSQLWENLNKIDFTRASQIDKNDRYRLERALTIWHSTGKKPSQFKPEAELFADETFIFILTRDRKDLYKRIDLRTEQMINEGWIEEVKNLDQDWINFLKNKKIIGYDNIIDYIEGKIDNKDELIEVIKKRTRNYAKRQLTFFRKFSRNIKGVQKPSNSIFLDWINLSKDNSSSFEQTITDIL